MKSEKGQKGRKVFSLGCNSLFRYLAKIVSPLSPGLFPLLLFPFFPRDPDLSHYHYEDLSPLQFNATKAQSFPESEGKGSQVIQQAGVPLHRLRMAGNP